MLSKFVTRWQHPCNYLSHRFASHIKSQDWHTVDLHGHTSVSYHIMTVVEKRDYNKFCSDDSMKDDEIKSVNHDCCFGLYKSISHKNKDY